MDASKVIVLLSLGFSKAKAIPRDTKDDNNKEQNYDAVGIVARGYSGEYASCRCRLVGVANAATAAAALPRYSA